MNELQILQGETAKLHGEWKALGEKITAAGYEPTKDETEQFDALERQVKEKQAAVQAMQQKSESENDRNERLARLKSISEHQAKLDDFLYRKPNEEADFARADQGRDLGMALAAFGRFACSAGEHAVTMEEAEAGKRLGVNFASGEFRITNREVLRSHARQLQAFYVQANRDRVSMARVELDGAFLNAETDALDSRVPERAGYLNRPPEFLNTLEMNKIAYAGILRAPITIMPTDHMEDVIETYGDDTTHSGRQIGEGQTIGTTLTPNFADLTFKLWKWTSDDVPVSNEQLMRSRFNLPSYIAIMLGERLGRIEGSSLTTGTGANTCLGIQTACTDGGTYVTSAVSPVIGYNDLIDLQHVLDPVYWNDPGTGWMMHPRVLPLLKKIKDGNGLPILNLGKEGTNVQTLLGQPIYWNNSMTAPVSGVWTAADKAAIYGLFPRYVCRRGMGGMPILIRDDTTNRRTMGTIFTALEYFDGRLRDYGANPLAELRIA